MEPLGVWITFGSGPSIPRACRATRGVRVGPLTPAQQSLIEESRNVLARPDVKLATRPANEAVRTCPLVSVEAQTTPEGVFRHYEVGDEPPGTRWYRYAGLDASLVPVEDCAVADRPGRAVVQIRSRQSVVGSTAAT